MACVCGIGLLAITLLSSCGQPARKPATVSIRFAYPDFDTPHYQALLEAFNEKYPDISVELWPSTWEGLFGLSAGDADVFVTQFTDERRKKGDIASLDSFMRRDPSFVASDFFPGTLGHFTDDDKTWALPAWMDVYVMFYNKDLFDRYDVPVPQIGWTWDDFLHAARGLRHPDEDTFGYGYHLVYPRPFPFIYQHGGRIYDDWQAPTRPTLDDPLTIEALEWWVGLTHEHHVAPTPDQAVQAFGGGPQDSYHNGIQQGKLGMWIGMYSERGGLSWPNGTQWEFNWGMCVLPRDVRSATWVRVEGFVISARSERPDACWKWIAFLSEQVSSRFIPARRSAAEGGGFTESFGAEAASVALSSMESDVLLLSRHSLSHEVASVDAAWQSYSQAVQQIIRGESSVERALRWAQEQAESMDP